MNIHPPAKYRRHTPCQTRPPAPCFYVFRVKSYNENMKDPIPSLVLLLGVTLCVVFFASVMLFAVWLLKGTANHYMMLLFAFFGLAACAVGVGPDFTAMLPALARAAAAGTKLRSATKMPRKSANKSSISTSQKSSRKFARSGASWLAKSKHRGRRRAPQRKRSALRFSVNNQPS
jgi:hypothetical protein